MCGDKLYMDKDLKTKVDDFLKECAELEEQNFETFVENISMKLGEYASKISTLSIDNLDKYSDEQTIKNEFYAFHFRLVDFKEYLKTPIEDFDSFCIEEEPDLTNSIKYYWKCQECYNKAKDYYKDRHINESYKRKIDHYITFCAHTISSFSFQTNQAEDMIVDLKNRLNTFLIAFHYQNSVSIMEKTFNDSLSVFNDKITKEETDISTSLKETKRKLDSAVDKAVTEAVQKNTTHTLTLMGVFTAVIAMVVSVAVTSSSWLSNANGASAIIAFVIPNLVIIIGIVLMLSFITFIYREGKKRQIFSAIVFGILITFAILFSSINIPKMITDVREGTVIHNRHILSENEFEIVKSTEEEPISFVFTFEFIEYTFEYDERLLHDGNLYFCEEHKTLE